MQYQLYSTHIRQMMLMHVNKLLYMYLAHYELETF